MPQLIALVLLVGLTWALVLLPQQRRVRAHRAFVASIDVGDQVVTTAGVFGTVLEVHDDRIRLEVAPGVVVTLARMAIGRSQADFDQAVAAERAGRKDADPDPSTNDLPGSE